MSATGTPQGAPLDFGNGSAGAADSPQWVPSNVATAPQAVLNDGTLAGNSGDALTLGPGGDADALRSSANVVRSRGSGDFTLEVGPGLPVAGTGASVPADAAVSVSDVAIQQFPAPDADFFQVSATFTRAGTAPGNNEVISFPIYAVDGSTPGPGAHREFIGHVFVAGPTV